MPTRRVPPADRDPLVDALVQVSFAVMAVLSTTAAEHDLSLTLLRVLAILRGRQLKMSELSHHLGLDRSTISGLVDRGEARGLLERRPSAVDGRQVDVRLTRAGARLAARGATEVATALAPMTGGLSTTDQRRVTALLEQMLGADEAAPDVDRGRR